MNKILSIAASALLAASCSHAAGDRTTADAHATTDSTATTITWIEDKPGPTLQDCKTFPTVPDSLWQSLGLQEGIPSSMSCFCLTTKEPRATQAQTDSTVTILIDAGLGAPFSQLLPRLAELGVTPQDLKLVYITHLHPDHIGGLLKDGKPTFPNATLWINRVEAEAWQRMTDAKAELPHAVLAAYKDHTHLFEAGDTLPGGVVSMAAYGHTPGHTVFQKDNILIIADLIHGAALQMEHPEYCSAYDMDPEAATSVRKAILEYARKNHLTMYGMHLPDPGYLK